MLRILVVDEDSRSRKQAADVLRQLACTVRTVGDPRAALSLVRQLRFDAILVSSSLPAMTPSAFLEAVHLVEPRRDMAVIAMAATPRTAIDAIRAGARGCVRKPIDVGGIVSALPSLLTQHPNRYSAVL
jgi:CheY-like chemotaxis protein